MRSGSSTAWSFLSACTTAVRSGPSRNLAAFVWGRGPTQAGTTASSTRSLPRPSRRGDRGEKAAPSGAHWHFGSPSFVAGEFDVEPTKIAQVLPVLALVMFDFHPSVVVARPDK